MQWGLDEMSAIWKTRYSLVLCVIFLWISIKIAMRCVHEGHIDKLALVQVIDVCWALLESIIQAMTDSLILYGLTVPWCVSELLMAWCKTVHWSYCSLARSYRYHNIGRSTTCNFFVWLDVLNGLDKTECLSLMHGFAIAAGTILDTGIVNLHCGNKSREMDQLKRIIHKFGFVLKPQ